MDQISVWKGFPQLCQGVGALPIVHDQFRVHKLVEYLSRHHNVIQIVQETIEISVKGAILSWRAGLNIGSIVSDIPGPELSITHIVDGIAINVEELGRMSGGIDALIITSINAALHPKGGHGPSCGGIQGIQPVGSNWITIWLHVKDVLRLILKLQLANDQFFDHQTGAFVISIAAAGQICVLNLDALKTGKDIARQICHCRLQTGLQLSYIGTFL